ncbi:MAG TPA: hypothetical protein VNK43_02590, partial [Gemmatimonadales bacterium]|nr:hypothetical protein [Gemmatimonadales bacterium]
MWRIWATTALLLAAAAGNGLAQGGRSAEPSFQGRTLREWMEDLEAPAPLTRHAAVYAIGGMGPRAAP